MEIPASDITKTVGNQNSKTRKKVLMITYNFPPMGGGGVQRNVKFLKYLSKLGWDTSVLTVKDTVFYAYDYSLLNEVENHTKIYRSGSLDPLRVTYRIKEFLKKDNKDASEETEEENTESGIVEEEAWFVKPYRKFRELFLLPDGYNGWIPFAYKMGKKIIKENRPDIIFGSFPGPSNLFITYKLAKKFNIPYILDFRDEWTDEPYFPYPTPLHRKYQLHHEKKIVINAERVIVCIQSLKDIFEKRYPSTVGKVDLIRNGFDPEDFEGLIPVPKKENKIRLVHTGHVLMNRSDNFTTFLKALSQVPDDMKNNMDVVFVGEKHEWADQLIASYNLQDIVYFTGYLDHKDCLSYLASADGTLLMLAVGDMTKLTGKIFEYLGMKLPVIAMVEREGACGKLLKSIEHDQGICNPANVDEITEKIKMFYNGKLPQLGLSSVKQFSRKYHSEIVDKILKEALSQHAD